ncbi:MAG: UDP-glucose 4-epimerase GalE [Firmicutes bacterium HGW-Firmicutes-16]|nr:MAG: UDP-glucose 4-epimerase GalE [Firmicutes bacterium HGW-Firmicutes-16]
MSKILVLGGAGYIGSHTVYELMDEGFEVVIADNLETGHRCAVHPDAKLYVGDIRDRAFLDGIFKIEKIDAVVHFAAYSLVGESMTDPLKYYANNVGGTQVLLSSMVANRVPKVVFSSSAATYGEPERIPILESDPTEPTNTYGGTKLAMEQMFKWTSLAHGIKYTSLRYFNACGAHPSGHIGEDHNPETHLIPIVLQAANGTRADIKVFGTDYKTKDGTCVRDYVHVCDLAQAHVKALRYLLAGGENDVFNLGNGVGFSVNEVIKAAEEVVGHEIPTVISSRRAGDPAVLVASSDKAKTVLGWEPHYESIYTILETAWKWHRAHPNGFDEDR